MMKIAILSLPIYSHVIPLLSFAGALRQEGYEVTFACSRSFKDRIEGSGIRYYPLDINTDGNTGLFFQTDQCISQKEQLEELLKVSKKGALDTLMFQTKLNASKLLVNLEDLRQHLLSLRTTEEPDLWVVDQLAHNMSIALYSLEEKFISFCSGHPLLIPPFKKLFGVPVYWPKSLKPDKENLKKLKMQAREVRKQLTYRYNQFIRKSNYNLPAIEDAFRFTSGETVVFNYPNFGHSAIFEISAQKLFCGTFLDTSPLPKEWMNLLKERSSCNPKILISFGTFFSARTDVLQKCIRAIRQRYPEALFIAASGGRGEQIADPGEEQGIVKDFIPQAALIPYADLVLHHGGCSTFRESLYYEKPMIVFPFFGDQFNIAYDIEKQELGKVLDPNTFTESQLQKSIIEALEGKFSWNLHYWSQRIKHTAPADVIRRLRFLNDFQRRKKVYASI